jgi:hypothetical protein
VELQLARRRRAVDAFAQADERDSDMLQLFEHCDEVPEIPPKPVQSPTHEHIESPPFGVLEQGIEGWPTILRSADAVIGIFAERSPPTRTDVAPHLL